MYELSKAPHVVSKLRAEIKEKLVISLKPHESI